MSRKDYQRFAEMLRIKYNNAINAQAYAEKHGASIEEHMMLHGRLAEIKDMAQEIADCFKADNGAFNRDRFMRAIFPNGE